MDRGDKVYFLRKNGDTTRRVRAVTTGAHGHNWVTLRITATSDDEFEAGQKLTTEIQYVQPR